MKTKERSYVHKTPHLEFKISFAMNRVEIAAIVESALDMLVREQTELLDLGVTESVEGLFCGRFLTSTLRPNIADHLRPEYPPIS